MEIKLESLCLEGRRSMCRWTWAMTCSCFCMTVVILLHSWVYRTGFSQSSYADFDLVIGWCFASICLPTWECTIEMLGGFCFRHEALTITWVMRIAGKVKSLDILMMDSYYLPTPYGIHIFTTTFSRLPSENNCMLEDGLSYLSK